MKKKAVGIWILLSVLCGAPAFCQSVPLKNELLRISGLSDSSNKKLAAEKLYLQFDKPYYAVTDTIWFKAYLLNASYLTASAKSGIMYIDIANDSNKIVKQYRFPVHSGVSWGNISITDKQFLPGTYTLRAYTNWMRNVGSDSFFYRRFYISNASENNWLVNSSSNTSIISGNTVVSDKLLFSDMDKKPYAVKPILLQVMDGSRHLYKQKLQTGVDGVLDINFKVPQKFSGLTIVAESADQTQKAVVPIVLKRAENTDVQFLPEGGNLVSGLPAHVGFKAIDENGVGIQVSGIITDHDQNQVTTFHSLHNGMGGFDLRVKEGESYMAKVILADGAAKLYPLPIVKKSGTTLRVKNLMESDSVEVSISATTDIVQSGNSYFLIGKARGIVCYAAILNFRDGHLVTKKIAKILFPTGITHFTLMTTNEQPLNERLIFIDHNDNLNVRLTFNKTAYAPRDSVALRLKVTDNTGKPVAGNYSLAVTDDAQVKADTLNEQNILSRFLLTADLKGTVENAGYYHPAKTGAAWQALDNLLLTQGWIGYNWQQALNPPTPSFEAEEEFKVSGRINNVFNKPVKRAKVLLFSKLPLIVMDTLTSNEGRFTFNHFPRVDTPIFILKAVNKNGRSFNVSVNVDEAPPPLFEKPSGPILMPWYLNSDSTLLNYTKTNAHVQELRNFPQSGRILKEVKITAKKIIKGSQNLNGPGNADFVMDEKDIEAAGKKTMLQLFQENIKGFRQAQFQTPPIQPQQDYDSLYKFEETIRHTAKRSAPNEWYFVGDKPVILYMDGVDIEDIFPDFDWIDFQQYLKFNTAEDIKGIEVNISGKYTNHYMRLGKWVYAPFMLPVIRDFAFVEVTTRSGHSAVIKNTPGMYLYKPLALSWPAQFYKPRYTVKDTAKQTPDLRSTISWEANITTGLDGEATVLFYAADKPSTYNLIIEGTDMNGSLGYKRGKITVAAGKVNPKP